MIAMDITQVTQDVINQYSSNKRVYGFSIRIIL